MATKKPALSTQLKTATARIVELEKQLESSKSNEKWSSERAKTAESEVEQVHAFLDAVPGAIAREGEGYGNKRTAMTRLAAWLSNK